MDNEILLEQLRCIRVNLIDNAGNIVSEMVGVKQLDDLIDELERDHPPKVSDCCCVTPPPVRGNVVPFENLITRREE